jgi:tetratricopeptide (TPR) repeat protein
VGKVIEMKIPVEQQRLNRINADRIFTQAGALDNAGSWAEAIKLYEEVVRLNPSASGALINLGTIYHKLGHDMEAERYYRSAIEVQPDSSLAHYNLANCLESQGIAMGVEECYLEALRLAPYYADAHYNLALFYLERPGREFDAIRHFKAYASLDPHSFWGKTARRELEKLETRLKR